METSRDTPRGVVAVFVARQAENFVATLRSVATLGLPVMVGGSPAHLAPLPSMGFDLVECWSGADLLNEAWRRWRTSILAVSDVVLVPPGFLDRAFELVEADLRVATVSFLSNDASFLSFPARNQPVERPVAGHDAQSITRRLRSMDPDVGPAPIPMAAGAAVVFSSAALSTLVPFEDAPSGNLAPALADFSLRGRQRGFVDLLDASTFYTRPSDLSIEPRVERASTGLTLEDNGWVHERQPTAHAFLHHEKAMSNSPLGLAHHIARVKIEGLRVLIDGTCLGPQEMGTQVITAAHIKALADRSDVREVCVALNGPVPPYATTLLANPKVRAEWAGDGDLTRFGRCDFAHRPFQPNEGFDVTAWRAAADRVAVSVLDLISFHIGNYSGDTDAWLRYRDLMRSTTAQVDALFVISEDVRRIVELERLPIDSSRVFVVPMGTEHLTGEEPACPPDELLARGYASGEFLLCLGTNYSHKNRDLALQAFGELRRRGWNGYCVLVGPAVPWGSSRALEARAMEAMQEDGVHEDKEVFFLPDLASHERNWLFRHASLVLYPTSAEGFGLVPFEAARFGTPTVYVRFGPLAEVGGEAPVVARNWTPEALADAAETLLSDPALAERQVMSSLSAGNSYTWARAAEQFTSAYRAVLARPPSRWTGVEVKGVR